MVSFDDFDAWGHAIRGANLRLACDAVQVRRWTLGSLALGDASLQVAFEGGGNICYGSNAHAGTMLFVPLSHSAAHVVNGESLDDESLLVIPRGADFRIHVRKSAHSWCSIAVPFDISQSSAWIARELAVMPELKRLARGIAANLFGRPADSAAHRAAGRDLAAMAAGCLKCPLETIPASGRPRLDRATIIRQAMTLIDAAPFMPTARDLAIQLDVTSRTLLRAFQESFGVSPKRYLMLRELHAVRSELRRREPAEATVADVLTRHGIWEFGRFATRYRRQFGELPSETLRGRRRLATLFLPGTLER
jgi:AraC family ethanolamine operon transcriptional activator